MCCVLVKYNIAFYISYLDPLDLHLLNVTLHYLFLIHVDINALSAFKLQIFGRFIRV